MAAKKAKQKKKTKKKMRILVVDDHPIVRQGLVELINHEKDLEVCGGVGEAQEALKSIDKLKPDMVTVDITLTDKSGLELIKDIKANYASLPVLALSMHDESLYAERVLRAGAKGYIMKHEATEKVVEAIRRVLSGQIYMSSPMMQRIMHRLAGEEIEGGGSPLSQLSDRELEVFRLIGKGYTTRQIAGKLHLSIKTIETYRAHIKEKLDFEDSAELLQYAIQWTSIEGRE